MAHLSFIFQIIITCLFVIQYAHAIVKTECSKYGCSLTAIDIWYDDKSYKDALNVLRSDKNQNLNNHDARNKAIETLKVAGDGEKTLLTLRGMKGGRLEDQINQDRAMIISPFHILPHSNSSLPSAQLLGVFDGHGEGGELTSNYAITKFPALLAAEISASLLNSSIDNNNDNIENHDSTIVRALKQVFSHIDRNDPSQGNAGCTATVVLQLGQKLFIANAGDSVSFVGVYFGSKSIQIVYQSREDKPDIPEEKARIVAAGGYVHVPLNDDDDVPRAYHIDENGMAKYGLAMSRSLGDWEVQGVISEPIVDILDLREIVKTALVSHAEACISRNNSEGTYDEKEQYCDALDTNDIHIFATSISDGMMDYLKIDHIGKVLAESFFDHDDNTLHPHSAAEKLVNEAAMGWEEEFRGQYRDDIAIATLVIPSSENNK